MTASKCFTYMCNCVLLRVSQFFVLVSCWCVCAHVLPVTLLAHPTLHKNAGLWSAIHGIQVKATCQIFLHRRKSSNREGLITLKLVSTRQQTNKRRRIKNRDKIWAPIGWQGGLVLQFNQWSCYLLIIVYIFNSFASKSSKHLTAAIAGA